MDEFDDIPISNEELLTIQQRDQADKTVYHKATCERFKASSANCEYCWRKCEDSR